MTDAVCANLRVGGPLDHGTATRLLAALRRAERDPDCRALVLMADWPDGTGGTGWTGWADFCTGMDLADPPGEPGPYVADSADRADRADRLDRVDETATVVWDLLTALSGSRLVTVAVVEGRADGGGVGLAAACDFVFAGPRAGFRLTEMLLGLVPALIMPFVVARTGERRMLRMALLAEPYDATAAREIGLADEADERPWEHVRRLLLALRRMPRDNVGELKTCRRLLNPPPRGYREYARRLLRHTVADPAVRDRITRLREEGALR